MARQRPQTDGHEVPSTSTGAVQQTEVSEQVTDLSVTLLGDSIEVVYSSSWEFAPIQYEKRNIFTSIKVQVPVESDLVTVGDRLSEMVTELQQADLHWTRGLSDSRGSLIDRVVPLPDENKKK